MKKSLIFLLSIFTLFFFVSCGSTPEEENVEPEAPVEEEIVDELSPEEEAKLLAEINDARNKAVEAGAETKVPEGLNKADEYFASIKDDKAKLKAESSKAVDMYNALIDEINENASKEELIAQIETARNKAIEKGAEEKAPDSLKKADDFYNSIKDNNKKLKDKCSQAVGKYDSIVVEIQEKEAEEKLLSDISSARDKAVKAGADKDAAAELEEIDNYFNSIKDDKEKLKAEGSAVIEKYNALTKELNDKAAEAKKIAEITSDITKARNRATELGADVKFAEEFAEIEDQFTKLLEADNATFIAEGKGIADGYNKLADRIVANETLLKNIDTARAKAVEAGAEEKAAEELKYVDDYLAVIKADDNLFMEGGSRIPGLYNSLVDLMTAEDTKKIIDDEKLSTYDENEYKVGVEKLTVLEVSYSDLANLSKTVAKDAETAKIKFNSVKNIAYKTMAKDARSLAYTSKRNADSVRAGVSQKDRYKNAAAKFQKGDSLYAMQNPLKAKECYEEAEKEFADLYSEVNEKREAAQKAIEAAKKNVAESASYAVEADEISPITGENVVGIEDEDTVLLEADNYEDPELAEIDVAETVEETLEDTEEQTEEEAPAASEVTEEVKEK